MALKVNSKFYISETRLKRLSVYKREEKRFKERLINYNLFTRLGEAQKHAEARKPAETQKLAET